MKKFFNSVRSKCNELAARAAVAVSNAKAEGYVDSGIKILIAVVIGALLLAALYSLTFDTVMYNVQDKVQRMFDYTV